MGCGQFFFKNTESIIFEQLIFQKKIEFKDKFEKFFIQHLTRSGRLAIDKNLLEFCLMEVQRTEYNFSNL